MVTKSKKKRNKSSFVRGIFYFLFLSAIAITLILCTFASITSYYDALPK